jgi:hypothetical protein
MPSVSIVSFVALTLVACADRGGPNGGPANRTDAGPYAVCASCGPCEEAFVIRSANHIDGVPIDYPDPPPTGGDHRSCWATWGVHTDIVPAENWVHNLEHGGVVFLHNAPDGGLEDEDALSQIQTLVTDKPMALYTAYPELPAKFAVVSWGHRLVSNCVDVQAAAAFYTFHVNRGPESIAGNPTCN